jgi:hypothetical protein
VIILLKTRLEPPADPPFGQVVAWCTAPGSAEPNDLQLALPSTQNPIRVGDAAELVGATVGTAGLAGAAAGLAGALAAVETTIVVLGAAGFALAGGLVGAGAALEDGRITFTLANELLGAPTVRVTGDRRRVLACG